MAGRSPRLLVSAGKEGRIYLLDRDQMGHFDANGDSQIVQSIEGAIGALFGGPAYFNNTLYFAASNDHVKAFPISEAHAGPKPSSQSTGVLAYPGAVPVISANGASNGILWLVEGSFGGTLHAYDASNLTNELYQTAKRIHHATRWVRSLSSRCPLWRRAESMLALEIHWSFLVC